MLDPYVEKANTFYMDRVEDAVILLHALGQYTDQLVRRCHRRLALFTPQPDSRCRPNLHCDVGRCGECRSQYLGQLSHVPHGSSAILTLPVCRARSAWASRSRSFAAHASTRWLRSTSSCCSSNTSWRSTSRP